MTLNIKHRHVELTAAITAYVEEKMGALTKYANLIRHTNVEVGKVTAHHKHGDVFFCKAIFELMNGKVLRIDRESENLYKAIDKVRDHARQELTEVHRIEVKAASAA